jgi:hypothetical protein
MPRLAISDEPGGSGSTTRPVRGRVVWAMLLLASIAAVSGCTPTADVHHASSGVGVALPTASAPPADGLSTGPTTASVATPRSRTSARPVPTSGGIRINSAGAILPDPARTPGAINPAVTQSDIGRTICVAGWTSTIRPPSSYTTALKQRELATGYAYRGDTNTSDYEEDHLISLELGGSPTAVENLWPEPYAATDGARVKDTIENKLHRLVCAGTISLSTAQHAIARNWYASYLTYVGIPT